MANPYPNPSLFTSPDAAQNIPAPAQVSQIFDAAQPLAQDQAQDQAQLIGNFNQVMQYVIQYIYPNINQQDLEKVLSEFNQLNNNQRFGLISDIIIVSDVDGVKNYQLSQNFVDLINADRKIHLWGYNNNYNDDPDWKALLEELTVIQLNSIVKPNVRDLFRAIKNKFRVLNRMIEIDRGIVGSPPNDDGSRVPGGNRFGRKYLKYKQKYLKLKNNLDN